MSTNLTREERAELPSAKEALRKALYHARRSGYFHAREQPAISDAHRQISDGYAALVLALDGAS